MHAAPKGLSGVPSVPLTASCRLVPGDQLSLVAQGEFKKPVYDLKFTKRAAGMSFVNSYSGSIGAGRGAGAPLAPVAAALEKSGSAISRVGWGPVLRGMPPASRRGLSVNTGSTRAARAHLLYGPWSVALGLGGGWVPDPGPRLAAKHLTPWRSPSV